MATHSAGYNYTTNTTDALGGHGPQSFGQNAPDVSSDFMGYNPDVTPGSDQAQSALLQQLAGQAAGTGGPTVAQQQLQSGTNANLASAMALSAAQRGQNSGAASYQLKQNMANINQQGAGQAAGVRAGEQVQAEGQLGQMTAANQQAENAAGQFNSTAAQNLGQLQTGNYQFGQNLGNTDQEDIAKNVTTMLASDEDTKQNISNASSHMQQFLESMHQQMNAASPGAPSGVAATPMSAQIEGQVGTGLGDATTALSGAQTLHGLLAGGTPAATAAGVAPGVTTPAGAAAGAAGTGAAITPITTAGTAAGVGAGAAAGAGAAGAGAEGAADAAGAGTAAGAATAEGAADAGAAGATAAGTAGASAGASAAATAAEMSPLLALAAAAHGRTVTKPTVVMTGEAGQKEAIVPLRRDGTPDEGQATGPGMKPFMDTLKAHGYQYRDTSVPGTAPGRHFGPTAQELEKTPVGASTVQTGADGVKRVDTGRLTLALAGATAEMNHRLETVEDLLKSKMRARRGK